MNKISLGTIITWAIILNSFAQTETTQIAREQGRELFIRALSAQDGNLETKIELLIKSLKTDKSYLLAEMELLRQLNSEHLQDKYATRIFELCKSSKSAAHMLVFNRAFKAASIDENAILDLERSILLDNPQQRTVDGDRIVSYIKLLSLYDSNLRERKDYTGLVDFYTELLEQLDDSTLGCIVLIRQMAGKLFLELDEEKYSKIAHKNLQKLFSLDQSGTDVKQMLLNAELYRNAKEYDLALKIIDRILELSANPFEGYLAKFFVYIDMKDYSKAEALLEKFNHDSWVKSQLSILVYYNQQNYEYCIKLFKEQLKNYSDRIGESDYFRMLVIAEQTKNIELLNLCWNKLRELKKLKDPTIANTIAYVAAVLNTRIDEAKELAQVALASNPNEGAFLDTMGWVLYRQGEYEKAATYIEKAISSDIINKGVIYEHAGYIFLKLNNKTQAITYFTKALASQDEDIDRQSIEQELKHLKETSNGKNL